MDTEIQREKGWIALLFCNNQVYVVSLQAFLCCPTLQESSSSYSSRTPPYNLVKKVKSFSFCIHKTKAIILKHLSTFIQCFGTGKNKQLTHVSLVAQILKITQQAEVSWSFTYMCHVQTLLLIFHLRWSATWLGDWWWANRLAGHFTQRKPDKEEAQANCFLADLGKRSSDYLFLWDPAEMALAAWLKEMDCMTKGRWQELPQRAALRQ